VNVFVNIRDDVGVAVLNDPDDVTSELSVNEDRLLLVAVDESRVITEVRDAVVVALEAALVLEAALSDPENVTLELRVGSRVDVGIPCRVAVVVGKLRCVSVTGLVLVCEDRLLLVAVDESACVITDVRDDVALCSGEGEVACRVVVMLVEAGEVRNVGGSVTENVLVRRLDKIDNEVLHDAPPPIRAGCVSHE
jgi:hypothetical protein